MCTYIYVYIYNILLNSGIKEKEKIRKYFELKENENISKVIRYS